MGERFVSVLVPRPLPAPLTYRLPEDWAEKMDLLSAKHDVAYLAGMVGGLSVESLPVVNTGHPGYSGLIRYRALFYQPGAAIRRFKLDGYPLTDKDGKLLAMITQTQMVIPKET